MLFLDGHGDSVPARRIHCLASGGAPGGGSGGVPTRMCVMEARLNMVAREGDVGGAWREREREALSSGAMFSPDGSEGGGGFLVGPLEEGA